MLFNSFSFLIFLPTVFVGYFVLPARFRVLFLLLASCYFYMMLVPKYIFILFFVIAIDYSMAFLIEKHNGKRRTLFLLISILANLSVLFFFKYFNFFVENVNTLAQILHWNYSLTFLHIVLPLGLSFHVFQSLSYVIEVYKHRYKPEKNIVHYALYVMFFPQLVAGPIERPQHLLPQINTHHTFSLSLARKGCERILWGFFKKLVIADQIAGIIDSLFNNLPSNGYLLILMALLFTYQIYCDFSGYSDIAVGSAMLFGFELTENFNRPFAARSISEFWSRWHISLSSWLKDYLYYPMVFSLGKISKYKLYISSLVTFTLIGLWHGANFTYVVFGALHGLYIVAGDVTKSLREKIRPFCKAWSVVYVYEIIQSIAVFLLVAFSLIFFRSKTIGEAWWFICHLTSYLTIDNLLHNTFSKMAKISGNSIFLIIFFSIFILEVVQYFQERNKTVYLFENKPKARFFWNYFLMCMVLFFGYFNSQAFLYFQF